MRVAMSVALVFPPVAVGVIRPAGREEGGRLNATVHRMLSREPSHGGPARQHTRATLDLTSIKESSFVVDIWTVRSYNDRYMDPKSRVGTRSPLPVRRALRSLGEDISTWRRLRVLTQTQLAERAGTSRGVVRRLEAADAGVSVENLLRVLRALGIVDLMTEALDPIRSDIGRLRANGDLPIRVRPKRLGVSG